MNALRCSIAFEIAWEQDDGIPRGMGLTEQGPRSERLGLYGELDILLKNGIDEFRPAVWDISDDIESMLTDFCADLVECCVSDRKVDAGQFRDFAMFRNGADLILDWRTSADSRTFSIPLTDVVREFFSAASRFHDGLKEAIGGSDDPRLTTLKSFFEVQERTARRALGK